MSRAIIFSVTFWKCYFLGRFHIYKKRGVEWKEEKGSPPKVELSLFSPSNDPEGGVVGDTNSLEYLPTENYDRAGVRALDAMARLKRPISPASAALASSSAPSTPTKKPQSRGNQLRLAAANRMKQDDILAQAAPEECKRMSSNDSSGSIQSALDDDSDNDYVDYNDDDSEA